MTSQINFLMAQARAADLQQAARRQPVVITRPRRLRFAGVLAIIVSLGTSATSTQARTFENNAQGSMVPSASTFARASVVASPATPRPTAQGNDLEWAYVTTGSGAAGLTLLAIGGIITRRRALAHRQTAQQHTTTA